MSEGKAERILFYHLDGVRKGDVDVFEQELITVGRSDDAHLRFDSHRERSVSAHHAIMRFQNGQFELLDTRSTNGTYVNGRRIEKVHLEDGDLVRFGALGPEVRVSVPSKMKERTIHDGQIVLPEKPSDDATPPPASIDESVMRLRHRRFMRNTLAVYFGVAVAITGIADAICDRFGLNQEYFASVLVLVSGGFIATLTLSLYHGRPGRQEVTKTELLFLIAITIATGAIITSIWV